MKEQINQSHCYRMGSRLYSWGGGCCRLKAFQSCSFISRHQSKKWRRKMPLVVTKCVLEGSEGVLVSSVS